MTSITTNGSGGKPSAYDWRDATKIPRRSAEEQARVEEAKARREAQRVQLDNDLVKTGEVETREVPVFGDDVPCRHCGKPWQSCICAMPGETRDEYSARMARGTGDRSRRMASRN
jgi:hypothetical protein